MEVETSSETAEVPSDSVAESAVPEATAADVVPVTNSLTEEPVTNGSHSLEAVTNSLGETAVGNILEETATAISLEDTGTSMNPVVCLDKLVESTINTQPETLPEPMEIPLAGLQEEKIVQSLEPIAQPEKVNITPQTPKQKTSSNFNLGVPGLNFSTENVKTADDGTKMVQIHQSQITPEQLIALQNNPNIKVVFRHVPSGKSYSKAPRHMLPPGHPAPARKRKVQYTEQELHASDVYSFDEGDDMGEGPTKMMKMLDNRARYSYGGLSKKRSGRSRMVPDPGTYTSSYLKTSKQQSMPAKVILTDLLARINNPNAKKEVRLHTSQINAEVLANLDLNPLFKIILTTKQELPPLVIENVGPEEKAELEKDVEEVEKQETKKEDVVEEAKDEDKEEENEEEPEEMEQEEQNEEDVGEDEEEQRLAEEKVQREKEAARQKKIRKEEDELIRSVMQKQTSRSGRIRKPSRYSLDIARLTKRKSVGVSGNDSSAEDSEHDVVQTKTPKASNKKEKVAPEPEPSTPVQQTKRETRGSSKKSVETKDSDVEEKPVTVRKRGRPSKKKSESDTENKDEGYLEKEEIEKSSKDKTNGKLEEKGGMAEEEIEKTVTQSESEKIVGDEKEKKEESVAESAATEKIEKREDKKDDTVSESEKEVTSTENIETQPQSETKIITDLEKKESETDGVVSAEPDTSTDAVKSSATVENEEPEIEAKMDLDEPLSLKIDEDEEEKEVIDNKYRLRKLLEQCSADEIRCVMLPEAFNSINMGDFLLYKSDQMHNTNEKISFPQLYKQFETLHKAATKEAIRYNTLVGRANKVGGDKRMEKIVLMPVYNIEAANSLQISNSSIDAHICGIQRHMTTQMIAANSFFIKAKMDSPNIRLKLPETTAQKHQRQKPRRPLYNNHHQQKFMTNHQQEPDSTTPDKPQHRKGPYEKKIAAMKYSAISSNMQSRPSIQVRKPTYFEQLKATGQIPSSKHNRNNNLQNIPVETSNVMKTEPQTFQMASASTTIAQLQAAVDQQSIVTTTDSTTAVSINPTNADTTLVTTSASETTEQTEQYFVTEDGVPVTQASNGEDGVKKHLVPIGDGQYVELPEGYSLIQTDEGYIIGQPGSTFTQGEDGNVYVTNSDGTTSEITEENVVAEGEAVTVMDTQE